MFRVLVVPAASAAKPDPAHADVVFQGSATDAALTAVLAVTPVDDPAHAASFDNPKNLSELPGTPIITFTWHDGQQSAMRLLPTPPPARPPSPASSPTSWARGPRTRARPP